MKKLVVGVFLLAGIVMSGSALAQEKKIAVLNIQAAILATDEAQDRLKDFASKADIAALRAQAESIVAESRKLEEDAQKNSVAWSDEEKAEFNKQIQYKQTDLEVVVKKLQNEERQIQQTILADMQEKALAITNEVIASEEVGLVLHPNAVQHADPEFNITQKVTDRLNKAK